MTLLPPVFEYEVMRYQEMRWVYGQFYTVTNHRMTYYHPSGFEVVIARRWDDRKKREYNRKWMEENCRGKWIELVQFELETFPANGMFYSIINDMFFVRFENEADAIMAKLTLG